MDRKFRPTGADAELSRAAAKCTNLALRVTKLLEKQSTPVALD
jgi:hypothetical protein